jgi:hypothetical protein
MINVYQYFIFSFLVLFDESLRNENYIIYKEFFVVTGIGTKSPSIVHAPTFSRGD